MFAIIYRDDLVDQLESGNSEAFRSLVRRHARVPSSEPATSEDELVSAITRRCGDTDV